MALPVEQFFNSFEIIDPEKQPTQDNWAFPPLYKIDQHGKIRMWQIGFDSNTNEIISIFGQVGGIIRPTKKEIMLNKSGRDYKTQALLEANKKYIDKYRKDGYRLNPNEERDIPLQLAKDYEPPWELETDEMGNITKKYITKTNIDRFPVAVQPKLNGIRSRTKRDDNGEIIMLTRSNRPHKWQDLIKQEIKIFFDFLPPGVHLDGELYIHGKELNEINSIVGSTSKTKHPLNDQVQYMIFDIIVPKTTFNRRYHTLLESYLNYRMAGYIDNYFKIITVMLAYSHEEIDNFHDQYVEMGYEGLMIRHLANSTDIESIKQKSYYAGGRNNNLLKYKKFQDEEGTIVEVYEGEGTEEGLAVFTIEDKNKIRFGVRPAATFEERAKWFQNPESVIGHLYTFKFFERSPYNVPLLPTGVGFREDI